MPDPGIRREAPGELSRRVPAAGEAGASADPEPVCRSYEIGERIAGRYEVLGRLGEGSTAHVFRVRDALDGREIALKLLKRSPDGLEDEAFRREFSLMARLHHRALAKVFDFDILGDGRPYFTMEIVEGRSLTQCAPLPGPEALRAVAALAGILESLHDENLVHSDLKPDNAILTDAGEVKMLDLGLAQVAGAGHAGGTPAYMAPEVIRGGLADIPTDLYSLGAVGYHLVTGRPPFGTQSAAEAIQQALHAAPPPLPVAAPPALASMVMALLSKDPALRPSAADVHLALSPRDRQDGLPPHALEAPLVGREEELARLELILAERLAAGMQGVVRVAGEAGTGKDRLLEAIRGRMQVAGQRFVSVRCIPGGAAYHPFEAAFKVLAPDDPLPWVDPALDSPRTLRAAIAARFAELTSAAGLVVHLADWHQADEASCALIDHLGTGESPGNAVFVLTIREEPIREGPEGVDLHVLPLLPDASGQLAQRMLGGTPVEDGLAADLYRLSAGNPLFLFGIVTQLLGRGMLGIEAGRVRALRVLDAAALPATLSDVLLAQVAALGSPARAVAETLAALGRPATPEFLAVASGAGEAIGPALAELEGAGVATERREELPGAGDPDSRAFSIVFVHGAMAEAVAASLPEDGARVIHERIVTTLESQLGIVWGARGQLAAGVESHAGEADADLPGPADREFERLPEIEELARHALIADPAGRGVRYGLAAARRSLERFALDQARWLIESCLPQVAAGTPLELAFSSLLADADRHAGRFEAACDRYARILTLLPPLAQSRIRLATNWGLALQSLSRYEEAMAAFEQAVSEARAADRGPESLRALTSIPRLAYLMGDSDRAARASAGAVEVARAAGDARSLGDSLGLMGFLIVMREPERASEGLHHLAESLALLEAVGDPLMLAAGLDLQANAQMTLGRPKDALATFERNLAVYRRVGAAPEDALTTQLNICLARLELGTFQRVAAEARRIGEEATAARARDLIVYAEAIESVALAQLGRIPEALDLLDRAGAGAAELESPYLGAAVRILGAEAKLAAGATLSVIEDLQVGRHLAAQAQTQEFEGRLLWLQADACMAVLDASRAGSACAELATLAERSGSHMARLRALLMRGKLANLLGDAKEAERLFAEAIELAERLQAAAAGGQAAWCRGRVREEAGRRELAREDFLAAQRAAATTASPHLMVDALFALSRVAKDADEAERFLEVARGHLAPILGPLDRAARAQYLAIADRQAVLERPSFGPAGSASPLDELLDRPLREILAAVKAGPSRSGLPVGELMARLLDQRPDPDEVLRRTLETARERFGAERCLAVLKVQDGFSVRHVTGARPEDLERFSRTFIDMATRENRTLWTIDAMTDPRLSATASVAALEMRAIACAPVRVQGRPVGALYLDWSDAGQAMREHDVAELETLAGVAGVCLAQAELLVDLQRRTDRLEMLQDLSGALAGALELDDLLAMALRNCIAIAGAERGAVLLGAELAVDRTLSAKGQAEIPMRFSRAILRRIQAEGRAFAVIDAEAEGASASITAEGLRSVMAVPFHVRGQLRGAFYLTSSVSVRDFSTRDLSLMEAVAGQVAVSLQRVDLVGELAQRERMRRELEIARDVQRGLAPSKLPLVPGVEIAAASVPALEVGGDFHDALVLEDGRIGLLVGDVVGKGVPAALMAATLLAAFRALAPAESSPARLLSRLNQILLAHRRGPGVWASAIYAIFEPRGRRLVYATAGHPPPLAVPIALPCEGLALGVTAEGECADRDVVLEPGAVFALYTDGFEDARGEDGAALGSERLEERFSELAGGGARAVVDGLVRWATNDDRTANLYDDITIVALRAGGGINDG